MRRIARNSFTQAFEDIELGNIARGTFFMKDVMVAHLNQDNFSLEMSIEIADKLIEQITKAKSVIPDDGNLHFFRVHISGILVQE